MAEFYPLLFGRGFSLPQLLFFCCFSSPLCRAPVPARREATLRIALRAALPAALHPGFAGALRARPCPCTPPAGFSPLRVLLPSAAR